MELREPPRSATVAPPDRLQRALLGLAVVLLAALLALALLDRRADADPEWLREVASRLKAAGALDEAAALYERYLERAAVGGETRASIAYSTGLAFLDAGRPEPALRWFYEAERTAAGDLAAELKPKIVHTLERMGRHHAAQAALGSLAAPAADDVRRSAADPVVARIGADEIRRSDLDRALEELPPEVARRLASGDQMAAFLERYVAEELLWRKAAKLEYDDDPEVRRRHQRLLKQLAVARFVEEEVLAGIEVSRTDLENFYAARGAAYARPGKDGTPGEPPPLEEIRPQVERDYRAQRLEAEYQTLIESELAAEDVELFPERLVDGG